MSPQFGRKPHGEPRFPRVSGDEPLAHGVQIDGNKFSPRERG